MKYIIEYIKRINPFIKINVRIGCPLILNVCHFGIDIANLSELAYYKTNDMTKYFNVDSIIFLDSDKLKNMLKESFKINSCQYCYGNCSKSNLNSLDW
jgi:glutamine phosphoribosylpyrophosphate amidotransferase